MEQFWGCERSRFRCGSRCLGFAAFELSRIFAQESLLIIVHELCVLVNDGCLSQRVFVIFSGGFSIIFDSLKRYLSYGSVVLEWFIQATQSPCSRQQPRLSVTSKSKPERLRMKRPRFK